MDRLIPPLYKEYGFEDNKRMLPSILDGMRPSERRALLSAYELAKDKFKKTQSVDSHATGIYHGHGTISGTITQLVQQGFLDSQGNFGSDIGIQPEKASAARYTECKMSKRSIDLFFKLIKYVPHVAAEVDSEKSEPVYLPAIFPLCLCGDKHIEGIGFGYRCTIPNYKTEDLYQRLLYLAGEIKEEPIIRPNVAQEILSSDEELKELLTTGNKQIRLKGTYQVDKLSRKVIITTFTKNSNFESLLKKLDSELSNNDIGWLDKSSKKYGGTYVEFEVLKQRNVDKIFNNLIQKIDDFLTGSITFNCTIIDENSKIRVASIDEMIYKTFEKYQELSKLMLKDRIDNTNKVIDEYKVLEKIRPVLVKYLTENEKIKNYKKAIKDIASRSDVNESQVKELFGKYSINKLLTMDLDTNELNKKLKEYNNSLKNIRQFVLTNYQSIIEGGK